MSGDVQPRKRKDKRKKKGEEADALSISHDVGSSHKLKTQFERKTNDHKYHSEKIHFQNDKETGGNNYIKIFFFCLFGLLVGTVGIIYLLSQSSTDVNQPAATENSKFAEYFAGWTDDPINNIDQHSVSNHNKQIEPTEKEEEIYNVEKDFISGEKDQNIEPNVLHSQSSLQEEEDSVKQNSDEYIEEETFTQSYPPQGNQQLTEEDINKIESGVDNDHQKSSNSDKYYDYFYYDNEYENENKVFLRQLKKFNFKTINKPIHYGNEDDDDDDDDNDDGGGGDDDDDDDDDNGDEDNEENYDASQTEDDDIDDDYKHDENVKNKEDKENKRNIKSYFKLKDKDKSKNDKNKIPQKSFNFKKFDKNLKRQKDYYNDFSYNEIDKSNKYKINKMIFKKKTYNIENDDKKKNLINEVLTDVKDNLEQELKKKATEVLKADTEEKSEEAVVTKKRVIIKLGVGIALIIVAQLVLVQKWKTKETTCNGNNEYENSNSEPEPVISRRQTLVPNDILINNEVKNGSEEEEEETDEKYIENESHFKKNESDEDVESQEEEEEEEEGNESEYFVQDYEIVKTQFNDKQSKLIDLKPNKKSLNVDEDDFFDDNEKEDNYEYDEHYSDEEKDDYSDEDYEENQTEGIYSIEAKNKILDFDSGKGEETTPYPSSKFQEGGAQFIEDEVKNVSEEVFEEDSQQDEIKSVVESDDLHHPETDPSLEEKKVGNEEDLKFSQEFKFADEQFENNPKEALRIYDEILAKEPTLLKALINRPRALDRISELERSNAYLKQAINAYKFLLLQEGHRIDDVTFEELANRCILRMRFGGYLVTAIYIHKALIKRFPQDPKHRNALAVTYLMLNKIEPARKLLNETLTLWPENGFALVHYGFIVKTTDKNMKEGAKLLMKGIKSEEDGVMDGMFFFHLGDALNRLGQSKEALTWYDLGVKKGLFLSRYQRSLYNVNRLKGQPWWTKEETTYQDFFKKLELNWKEIRKEGLNLLNSKGINLYKEESENLKDTGDWRQLDLFFRGRMQYNCQKAPITCSLVSSFKPAAKCTRGQIKFSVMLPNTHVWPHCGPTNCRLRSHLGLVIPPKTYLRVAEETRSWEEGKFIIFDDSFEHEVWHNGTGLRLVLIVDVWHPELTEREWLSLSPI